MQTLIITFLLSILFVSAIGIIWIAIHISARNRLGERSGKACEFAGDIPEHCCQYVAQCPEEIRSKCKHAVIKS